MPPSTYGFWFEPLRPVSTRGATLFVTGPRHARRWVARRYPELLRAALQRSGSGLRELEFIEDTEEAAAVAAPAPAEGARVTLNPAYTFERFVIGPGNRIAHGAALAVAEAPGESYNPLFLHGPPGLGKTHLLGAIANYLHIHSPNLTVHYTTAESFTNEFVGALRTDIEAFKRRYRRSDVLLIDDVQFLEGKDATAEEFFHTFNALYESGSQLVLTADRLPAALSGLAARIRDRFEWGLVASLDPPDQTTRLLFLGNLVSERSGQLAPEAIREIASRPAANLRVLEGALTRVVAHSSLTGAEVSPESIDQALPARLEPVPDATPSIDRIQRHVAERLDVPVEEILARNRRAASVAKARQLAMYLSRRLTDASLPAIASAFNRSDHTTVMHAIRKVEERSLADPALARRLERLAQELSRPPKDRDRTD